MSEALVSPNTDTAADLDGFAWQAICGWPEHSAIEVARDGLDYGALTRYFLWDKVPRAIRARGNPADFAFEQALLERVYKPAATAPYPRWKTQVKRPFQAIGRIARVVQLRLQQSRHPLPVLFVPRQHFHLRSTLAALLNEGSVRLVAPVEHGDNPGVQRFQPLSWRPPDLAFAEQLYGGIVRGLQAYDIDLLAADRQQLREQIAQQMRLVRQIEAELAIASPQAVLVFADTHSPSQEYVAIANRQGIPTIMFQHGLDCEHYCLEAAHASAIAVWGEARKQRYQKVPGQQPALIQVTGNPEYDGLQLPDRLQAGGDCWLWATRPHGPEKCYAPSRQPREGRDILAALLAALKQTENTRLIVKPHPLDYVDLYAAQIEKHQLGDRVTLTRDPLQILFSQVNVVVSEDSTAAMEAMFSGKIVIHAHFADSEPVLPLVEYAAALPAGSPAELAASLQAAGNLTAAAQQTMLQGQRRFINDYAGPFDGRACERVTALIGQVIARKVG